MKADELTLVVKNDNLILAFGSKLYTKHGHEKHLQVQYVSQKMHELARFLICAREIDSKIQSLHDCIQANKFTIVIAAVKKLCGFDENTHRYSNPHLAMKVGHSLNHCASIALCESLMRGDKDMQGESKAFGTLYKKTWASEVSNHALETIRTRKWNKPNAITSAEDIRKLNSFLKNELHACSNKLKETGGKNEWEQLNKTTLALLILFN